jgi:hypothetical protein
VWMYNGVMLETSQLQVVEEAVAAAQRSGDKQRRERSTKLGGMEIEGPALRWVEVASPPVVYFPDAHGSPPSLAAIGTTVSLLMAFGALVLAVACVFWADWLFLGIFGPAAIVLGAAGVWLSRVDTRQRAAAREGVETSGLYLTPDALMHRTDKGRFLVPRGQVLRFGTRKTSDRTHGGASFEMFMEVSVDGRTRLQGLKNSSDRHLLEYCHAWLDGRWPLPLPR